MSHKTALILVDLQNDFCPGGHLAVPGGDTVIPLANQLQSYFDIIVASQDWHPEKHVSFASTHRKQIGEKILVDGFPQVLWPDHCIQHSKGAAFHPHLSLRSDAHIVHKGTDINIDSYSAFFDNEHLRSTELKDYLIKHHVKHVYILGLATDYCVKYTALDAKQLGFEVFVIADACKGVELTSGDVAKALAEMQKKGIHCIDSSIILETKRAVNMK